MSLVNPKRPPNFTQEKVIDGASNAAALAATTTLPCCTMDGDFFVDKFEVQIPGGYTADATNYYDISLQIAPSVCTATAATDVVALAAHGFATGDSVQFTNSGGGLPAGLIAGVTYFVVVVDGGSFKVSDTLAHALAGTNIVDITTAGTGTQTAATVAVAGAAGSALINVGEVVRLDGANGSVVSIVQDTATGKASIAPAGNA